jgi:HAE1 family hydrophobic/amphiphilic exporter-1
MTFSELGIKRHVMAYMVAYAIMLFGMIGYSRIGVDEYPAVDFPAIIVLSYQQGSDAEVVDNTITSILLDNLNGIAGIDTITGISYPGVSRISVVFDLEKDIDIAFNEVQAKINLAISQLPSDIDPPKIIKANNTEDAVVRLTLSGNRTIQQLNVYADQILKKKLETIDGISEVQLEGERQRVLRVEFDIFKLSSFGISVGDIIKAINDSHIQMPGGYIISDSNELLLNLDFEAHSIEDFKNIVVKSTNSSIIKLGYIANIVDDLDDFRKFSSYNSLPSITLGITKIVGANAFSIEEQIMDRVNNAILPNLEPGLNLDITHNVVDYIKAVVASLQEHLFLGTFLTALIVFLFLRSFISTLIVSLAIPISLLGAVFIMYLFGYTFNTITLLALLLLIGVVVDDAIIVLENIYKKIEEGMDPQSAALEGSNQVVFAVLAATLSLVSIFGPVVFMDGIIGRFFKSFAVVVSFGIIISYFVSLYITPMLCSRYLRNHSKEKLNWFYQKLENFFVATEKGYLYLLTKALNHNYITMLLATLIFLSSFLFFDKIPVEFAADGDRAQFKVFLRTPQGSNIYNTLDKIALAEEIIKKYPEVKEILTDIGGNNGGVNRARLTVNLVPVSERDFSQYELMKKIEKDLGQIAGATFIASPGSSIGGSAYKMEFNLVGANFQELYQNALKLKTIYEETPQIGNIDLSVDFLPQLKFEIDREKIALLKITSKDVLQAIGISVGGIDITKFNEFGSNERFDVRLKGIDSQFTSSSNLNSIYIKTPNAGLVRLDSVVKQVEYLGFSSIEQTGQLYSISVRGNPSVALGEATAIAQKIAQENLPSGYSLTLKGNAKELQKTIGAITFVFGVSLLLLYMVLASQFNSFIQPVVLMMSIPLAIVGGLGGLYLTNHSLNMFSMIGMILLIGLVAKNAILLVDFSNELRAKGVSIKDALLQSGPSRLRPILMTSITVIISMIPALLSNGAGSENNAAMSAVVIGGMISSTLLTLVVIPAIYYSVESYLEYLKNKKILKNKEEQINA